ncbi:MAG: hypothetical protein HC902_13075, partial [Calothrix sp. SM1_5_4]|nr:hypothetical protein [Calothrix sp. SM1_5_4]
MVLVGVLLAFVTTRAHGEVEVAAQCADLLSGNDFRRVVSRVNALNPELLARAEDAAGEELALEALYLSLKAEEYAPSFTPAPRAPYAGESMSEAEKRQFYLNALHSLQVRVAALWKRREARALLPLGAGPSALEAAALVLDTFFSPYGLEDRELGPGAG